METAENQNSLTENLSSGILHFFIYIRSYKRRRCRNESN